MKCLEVKVKLLVLSVGHQHISITYLWPDRVLDPNNTDGCEVIEDAVLIFPVGLRFTREVTVPHTNGPQAITRHGLDHLLHHLVLVPWTENPRLTHLVQDMAASGRKYLKFVTLVLTKRPIKETKIYSRRILNYAST